MLVFDNGFYYQVFYRFADEAKATAVIEALLCLYLLIYYTKL